MRLDTTNAQPKLRVKSWKIGIRYIMSNITTQWDDKQLCKIKED